MLWNFKSLFTLLNFLDNHLLTARKLMLKISIKRYSYVSLNAILISTVKISGPINSTNLEKRIFVIKYKIIRYLHISFSSVLMVKIDRWINCTNRDKPVFTNKHKSNMLVFCLKGFWLVRLKSMDELTALIGGNLYW